MIPTDLRSSFQYKNFDISHSFWGLMVAENRCLLVTMESAIIRLAERCSLSPYKIDHPLENGFTQLFSGSKYHFLKEAMMWCSRCSICPHYIGKSLWVEFAHNESLCHLLEEIRVCLSSLCNFLEKKRERLFRAVAHTHTMFDSCLGLKYFQSLTMTVFATHLKRWVYAISFKCP